MGHCYNKTSKREWFIDIALLYIEQTRDNSHQQSRKWPLSVLSHLYVWNASWPVFSGSCPYARLTCVNVPLSPWLKSSQGMHNWLTTLRPITSHYYPKVDPKWLLWISLTINIALYSVLSLCCEVLVILRIGAGVSLHVLYNTDPLLHRLTHRSLPSSTLVRISISVCLCPQR